MKVIQVGIGGMGNRWLETVLASDEIEYAGFVEVSDEIATQQATQHGLDKSTIFKTLPEALDKLNTDAVIDVTPPRFHREVSTTALKAGLPVLSEKPLGATLEDAQAIIQTANETGILHMVAQNYRYSAAVQTLKSILVSGVMGTIGAASAEFYKGAHFSGFRTEMPQPLIIDMAIHHFDMMRFLLGSNAKTVFARSWNPPWSWYQGDANAAVTLEFENGTMMQYNGSWCAPGIETTWNANWRFDCEKGVVTMVDDIVTVHPWTGVDGFNNVYAEPKVVPRVTMEREAQAYLLHEFYEAVTQGKTPVTTCQDNIHSLQIVFDVVESCTAHRLIEH